MEKNFLSRIKEKVLIFDGAMGTSIHKYDLSLDDYHGYENCPEILVESRPDVIQEIHESYLKAGCDAVETDTFGGSPVVLAEFDLAARAYELNKKAAQLAREVASSYSTADKPRFVSGSIGPTTKLPSLGHISFADMKDAYYAQVSGLIDGGVDVLQFETGQDLMQAKAAIIAILDYFKKIGRRLPIIAQVTIEAPPLGTMLVGSDISCALTTLSAFPIDVIGINCATGPAEMLDPVHYLTHNTDRFVSVLPNAGLPENVDGQTVYKLTPDALASALKHFALDEGVNIIGGCCGTTPDHLKRVVTEIQIPLVVDTTEYPVLKSALECISGKPIVNSINLEDGEESMMRKVELITRFGAATVALTIDEEGMARSADRKLEIARRIYKLTTEAGLAPHDLIFDALTFTLSTGNEEDRKLGLETLKAIKSIKEELPGVKTILGVSNISFGFDPAIRQTLNSVFMHYAVEYGLDLAIVNAQKILPLFKIEEEEREYHRRLIFDERDESYDPLFALLDYYKRKSTSGDTISKRAVAANIED